MEVGELLPLLTFLLLAFFRFKLDCQKTANHIYIIHIAIKRPNVHFRKQPDLAKIVILPLTHQRFAVEGV